MSNEAGPSAETQEATPEELDFSSEKFNPLKALYSTKLKLPFKNIKPLDNIAAFESRIKRAGGSFEADINKFIAPVKQNKSPQKPEVDETKYHVTQMGRVFLKEQGKLFYISQEEYLQPDSIESNFQLLSPGRNLPNTLETCSQG